MAAGNAHYYATRDPFGAAGDFTTAPEISQMFGELIGAALADCWQRAGAPADAAYVELGPGRGTLAADALRVMRAAGFAAEVHSSRPARCCARPGASRAGRALARRHRELPQRPLLLVANEFFDALPIRQFVGGDRAPDRALQRAGLPSTATAKSSRPRRRATQAVDAIAAHLAEQAVRRSSSITAMTAAPGDTLQAVRGHRFTPILERPGEQDLTAHVDFEPLAAAAREGGATVTGLVGQGAWLKRSASRRAPRRCRAPIPSAPRSSTQRSRGCAAPRDGRAVQGDGDPAPDWPQPAGFA